MPGWRKWLLPGMILVVLLTGVSARYLAPFVERELRAEISSELEARFPWLEANLQVRDLTLKGTAPSRAELDELNEIVDSIDALDRVENLVGLLPAVTPYRLSFSRVGDKMLLTGYVPTEDMRKQVISLVRERLPGMFISDQLGFARGEPDRFFEVVRFSFDQLVHMKEGIAALQDNTLDLSGRAEDPEAFETIVGNLGQGRPAGFELGRLDVQPPLVKPYTFSITKTGEVLVVTGFVPSEEVKRSIEEEFRGSGQDHAFQPDLKVAAGAPVGLADAIRYAKALSEALAFGEVTLSDDTISVSGMAQTPVTYETVRSMLENPPPGYSVLQPTIKAPLAEPFVWSVLLANGSIVLEGFAPSLAQRKSLVDELSVARPQTGIANELQISTGEPEAYDTMVRYVADLLPDLATATFRFEDSALTFEGRANSVDTYETMLEKLNTPPAGLSMAGQILHPPTVSPYRLSITQDGQAIRLSGFVPSEAARSDLREKLGGAENRETVFDETLIAAGASDTFLERLDFAISLLPLLSDAEVVLEGEQLTIAGRAKTSESYDVLLKGKETAIKNTRPRFALKPPLVPQHEISLRLTEGEMSVSGFVPDSQTRSRLVAALTKAVSQRKVASDVRIAEAELPGADLIEAAQFMAKQSQLLEKGSLTLAGSSLSVSGLAKTGDAFEELEQILNSGLPADVTLGTREISIPVSSPYVWSVSKEENEIELNGVVPDRESARIVSAMAQAIPDSGNIRDNQKLASGQPQGFEQAQRLAMTQIGLMDNAEATITDARLEVRGLAPDEDTKLAIEAALKEQAPAGFSINTDISFVPPVAVPQMRPVDAPVAEELVAELQTEAPQSNEEADIEETDEPEIEIPVAEAKTALTETQEEQKFSLLKPGPGAAVLACQQAIIGAIDGRQIFFERNGEAIRPESNAVLVSIALATPECSGLSIEVAGYADADGDRLSDKQLSQARAETVRRFLVNEGVPASQLLALGHGIGEGLEETGQSGDNLRRNRIEFIVVE